MSAIELIKINDFKDNKIDGLFYGNTIQNHLEHHHSRIEKPHKHNFYAVFLFTKGHGIHEIDFQKYEVKPGSVFFLYPGQTHAWELSEDIKGFLFFHSAEFYELAYASNSIKDFPFFESNYTEKCFYLDTEQLEKITLIFEQLYKETLLNEWKKKQLILSYLTQLYIQLNRYIENKNASSTLDLRHYQTIFFTFEKLVDAHFDTIKSASKYAQLLNISQKHLNRIVKSVTNKTTTDIITERIILEAKRQLIYSNLSLNEIALKLGYEDAAYFSRIFKKNTLITASDFREEYKRKDKE